MFHIKYSQYLLAVAFEFRIDFLRKTLVPLDVLHANIMSPL